jgi:hypothetical protein
VTRQATLVKECLQEARALVRSKGKTLQWLECLPRGIRASKQLVLFVKLVLFVRSAPHARRLGAGS